MRGGNPGIGRFTVLAMLHFLGHLHIHVVGYHVLFNIHRHLYFLLRHTKTQSLCPNSEFLVNIIKARKYRGYDGGITEDIKDWVL